MDSDQNPDLLAGEWKNFNFRSIQESDYPDILIHLRDSFYKDEPTQIIGGMSEDRKIDLDNRILVFLKEKMSFMAICKSTKRIAGIVIMSDESVDKVVIKQVPISPLTPPVRTFMTQLGDSVNIFEKYGIQRYGDIYILAVHQDFRNLGLATEMFKRAMEYLKGLNYKVIQCTFSNPYSRRIGENMGFVELVRMKYCEGRDHSTGELLFPNAPSDLFVNVTALDLRQK